ncbi:unnamed protein product, partial [Meganyctiphanes norvegica]
MWSPWSLWLLVILIINSTNLSTGNLLESKVVISDDNNETVKEPRIQENHINKLYSDIPNGHMDIMEVHNYEVFNANEDEILKESDESYSYKDPSVESNNVLNSGTKRSIRDYDYNYNSIYMSKEPLLDYGNSLQNTEYKDHLSSEENTYYDDSSELNEPLKINTFIDHNDSKQSENINYLEYEYNIIDSLERSKVVSNVMEFTSEFVIKDGEQYENLELMPSVTRIKRSGDHKQSDEKEKDNNFDAKAEDEGSSEKSDDSSVVTSKEEKHSVDGNEDRTYYSLEIRGKGIEMGGGFTEENTDDEKEYQNKEKNEKQKRKSRNFFEAPLDPLAEDGEENKNKKVTGNNNEEENYQENTEVGHNTMTQNTDISNKSKKIDISLDHKLNSKENSQEIDDILLDNDKIKLDKNEEHLISDTKDLNEAKNYDKLQKNDPILTALENISEIEVLEVNTTDSIIKPKTNKKLDGKSQTPKINNTSHKVKKKTKIKNVNKSNSTKTHQKETIDKENIRIHKGSKYINFVELDKMLEQMNEINSSIKRTEKSLGSSNSNSSENGENKLPKSKRDEINDNPKMVVNKKVSGNEESEKDLTVTYNINNNKIYSYDMRDLYNDNNHILASIQKS